MNHRPWSGLSLLCFVFLVVSCGRDSEPTGPGQPEHTASLKLSANSWTTRAPMPTPRTHLAAGVATLSGQQLLYAIGGFDPSAGSVSAVEAYNYVTNSWSTRAPLPVALTHTNGVGNIDGRLYLSGGLLDAPTGGGLQRSLYVYNPYRNTWAKKANMPKRTGSGVTGVIGGKLYVLVGTCADCAVSTPRRLFRYDPATDSWTGALPVSPNAHVSGAGGVINGKFYVAGGRGRDGRDSNKLDMYDPATNSWTTLAPMPTARSGVAGAVVGGKLYVIGQANVEPGELQNQVEAYDPVRNRWITKASLPGVGRGDLAAGRIVVDGRGIILAVGGTDVEGSGAGDVNQAYTP
ncbi:MAG TPA: kelch repeat-containing protein [Actinomycetota bacterium]|nr:kelch repeat-containing protein [Actinomycetota bacterium]